MAKLADLRDKLKATEEEIAKLQAELASIENIQLTPVVNEVKKPKEKRLDTSFELDNTYHCLQLSVCLLEDIEVKNLTPQLRELCDTLVSRFIIPIF